MALPNPTMASVRVSDDQHTGSPCGFQGLAEPEPIEAPERGEGRSIDREQLVESIVPAFDNEMVGRPRLLIEGQPHESEVQKDVVPRRLPGSNRSGRQGRGEDGLSAAFEYLVAARLQEAHPFQAGAFCESTHQ